MAQPSTNDYAINKYGFFPLDTPLASPGDIFESEQAGYAFVVGPESDVARVNMAYFDDQLAATKMRFETVSSSRSLTGPVFARNDAKYSPSNRPGRILFWSADIYDPNFRPSGFEDPDEIQFIAPRLEILTYFYQPTNLTPWRNDKEFNFQNYVDAGGTLYIVVPYYGRKYCYVNFTNRNTVQSNTFGILGVNYAITDDSGSNPYHQETVLLEPAAISSGDSVTKIIRASTNGMFDALVFSVDDAGPAPLRIAVSDRESP